MKYLFSLLFFFVMNSSAVQAAEATSAVEQTFSMIKPRAVQEKHIGAIIDKIEQSGLRVVNLRMVTLSAADAKAFYKEHEGKSFFEPMVEKMTSGPVVAMVIEGPDAVKAMRTIIGATDPAKAAPGTIRALFGKGVSENAIHGSDSTESATREIAFFFGAPQPALGNSK